MSEPRLRVIPLGGLGEIGKNMMALEYQNDIMVVDAGVMFPEEDMLGVDLVLPDFSYLLERKEKVRGIAITHGHEDHTGAVPFVLKQLNVPVYAPPLAHGLIQLKLREHKLQHQAKLHKVEAGAHVRLGAFNVEFFRVCHSIPDAMGLAIRTPVGLVVHTGDFKFDHTPVDGKPSDFGKLAELGEASPLLLMSDSTYAEMEGYTPSETVVSETFDRVMAEAPGRVIVATFASLVSRVQQVVDAAAKHGRRVAIVGRSMSDTANMAMKMGYLKAPKGVIAPLEHLQSLAPNKVAIVTTGTQGEPTSVLVRVANRDHRQIQVIPGDTIVMSATAIPGNETVVYKTIDNLFRQGANVLYDKVARVHVHGHAAREELKLMINLVKPQFFVPVHGEYRHLVHHAKLAQKLGIPEDHTFVLEDGDVLELTPRQARKADRVSANPIYVDGLGMWDPGSTVLRDRRVLSQDGIVVVVLAVDGRTGQVVGEPDVVSLGFAETTESAALVAESKQLVVRSLDHGGGYGHAEAGFIHAKVRDELGRFLYQKTRRRPLILPVAVEI